jgi:hypothetical protein
VLVAIKAVHTVLFFSIATAVMVALWDGITGKPQRRTAVAGTIVLIETGVFASNNQVCPLVAGSAALAALAFNVRALIRPTDERLSTQPHAH